MIKTFFRRVATFVMASLAMSTAVVWERAIAAEYPVRPIRIIVPFAAGGGADNALRAVVPALERRLGQSVVVLNMPSGSGSVGIVKVVQSSPDGYTLGVSTGTTVGTNQVFTKNMPYNAAKDLDYIAVLGEGPRGVFVKTGAIKDYQQFANLAKDPAFNMVAGVNSNDMMNAEIWKAAVNITTPVIPYPGNTAVYITDLLGDRIQGVWLNTASMVSCMQNNTCRPVAVTGRNRLPEYPDVPTFRELGFKGINAPSYFGIVAPVGVPPEIKQKLNRAVNEAIAEAETQAKFKIIGIVPLLVDVKGARDWHIEAIEIGAAAGRLMKVEAK
jgi:tripartite-type tricarboxylate transporter receptor subunit TctC